MSLRSIAFFEWRLRMSITRSTEMCSAHDAIPCQSVPPAYRAVRASAGCGTRTGERPSRLDL